MVEDSVKVKSTKTVVYEAKNKKQTGNLKIIKQDADSEKTLEGVSFKIKRKDENKYIQVKTGDGWKIVGGSRCLQEDSCQPVR